MNKQEKSIITQICTNSYKNKEFLIKVIKTAVSMLENQIEQENIHENEIKDYFNM